MATSKKFAVAGVSTLNGKTKVRFANDTMRIKILAKNGHRNVELITLPNEMTKAEIAQYMTDQKFGSDRPEVVAAISYIAKKNKAPAAAKTTAKKAAVTA